MSLGRRKGPTHGATQRQYRWKSAPIASDNQRLRLEDNPQASRQVREQARSSRRSTEDKAIQPCAAWPRWRRPLQDQRGVEKAISTRERGMRSEHSNEQSLERFKRSINYLSRGIATRHLRQPEIRIGCHQPYGRFGQTADRFRLCPSWQAPQGACLDETENSAGAMEETPPPRLLVRVPRKRTSAWSATYCPPRALDGSRSVTMRRSGRHVAQEGRAFMDCRSAGRAIAAISASSQP